MDLQWPHEAALPSRFPLGFLNTSSCEYRHTYATYRQVRRADESEGHREPCPDSVYGCVGAMQRCAYRPQMSELDWAVTHATTWGRVEAQHTVAGLAAGPGLALACLLLARLLLPRLRSCRGVLRGVLGRCGVAQANPMKAQASSEDTCEEVQRLWPVGSLRWRPRQAQAGLALLLGAVLPAVLLCTLAAWVVLMVVMHVSGSWQLRWCRSPHSCSYCRGVVASSIFTWSVEASRGVHGKGNSCN